MTEDREISERYRSLGREEPPRELDAAILAAARRAAETRPAPLVVPTGRSRWYFPLAAAAIIVLAVAVTIQVERQQPDADAEAVVPPVTAPKAPAEEKPVESEPARKAAPQVFVPDPKPAPQAAPEPTPAPPPPATDMRDAARADPAAREKGYAEMQRAPAPATEPSAAAAAPAPAPRAAPAPAPAPPPKPAPRIERQDAVSGVRERRAEAERAVAADQAMARAQVRQEATTGAVANFAFASPEQLLQGIADLRRQGRHEEADKALADFRKRYPDYKISEAMLEKVEKR